MIRDKFFAGHDAPDKIFQCLALLSGSADGNPLTVTNLTQPANGTATPNADDTVTYTPDADFNGSDAFTYTANDGITDGNVATSSRRPFSISSSRPLSQPRSSSITR